MFGGEFTGQLQHSAPVKCHTGFQGQVFAQHKAHANRIGLVIGNTEVKDSAAGGGGFDRMPQGGHLVADSFDDDIGAVAGGQSAHPAVAGRTHRLVDSECRCVACAVDGIDPGDAPRAGRFGDVGEQQADGALADDRDVPAGQLR